jgi:uncharacterized membrane protein YfcA
LNVIADPWFYAAAVPAVLIAGIAKGGVAGGGVGMLGTMIMVLAVPPVQAAAIMLPILCLMDIIGTWTYRRSWDRRSVLRLTPGAIVGIALGAATFGLLDENWIRLMIGALTVAFIADQALGLRARLASGRSEPPGPVAGAILGGLSGYTSFVIHSGAPPAAMYLLPQRLDKAILVGTTMVFFLIVNYAKLPPYAFLGLLSADNVGTALALAPLAPLGIWLGVRLQRRIPQAWFYRISYVFLLATGLKLIADGIRPLLG